MLCPGILFASGQSVQLSNGNAASYSDVPDVQKANEAANLGKKWQESILDVCDQHFFFTQVHKRCLHCMNEQA